MSNRGIAIWKVSGISGALAGLVWVVFGQTVGHSFVNFDDATYVYRNVDVARGLSTVKLVQALKMNIPAFEANSPLRDVSSARTPAR